MTAKLSRLLEQTIISLYVAKKYSGKQVAKIVGVSDVTVYNVLRRNNITARPIGRHKRRNKILYRGGTLAIRLTNCSHHAYIDAADLRKIDQYTWYQCDKGYAVTYIGGKRRRKLFMHRLVLGSFDGMTDHINGNRLDNTQANLRKCTALDNARNASKRPNTSSRFKGVSWHKRSKRWYVNINTKGKRIFIGQFRDETEAAKAYDAAALQHHGVFAKTNKDLGLY